MQVAKAVDEVADPQVALLGHQVGQQGIAGDIEGHPEEEVGAALVELAGEPPVADIKLKQAVAGGERHAPVGDIGLGASGFVGQVRRVPGGDHQPAGVGAGAYRLDQLGHLVEGAPVGAGPTTPLTPVDGAQVPVRRGPFVPDRYPPLAQPGVVGGAAEEPQQLQDHALGVDALGGEQREALAQVEADLPTKHRAGAHTGAVGLVGAVVDDVAQQVQVGLHGRLRGSLGPATGCGSASPWARAAPSAPAPSGRCCRCRPRWTGARGSGRRSGRGPGRGCAGCAGRR